MRDSRGAAFLPRPSIGSSTFEKHRLIEACYRVNASGQCRQRRVPGPLPGVIRSLRLKTWHRGNHASRHGYLQKIASLQSHDLTTSVRNPLQWVLRLPHESTETEQANASESPAYRSLMTLESASLLNL